jgi:hypothetical protein
MLAQKFFKLFPPPKFLDIPYAGLHISDDAIHFIEYTHSRHNLAIRRFGSNSSPLKVYRREGRSRMKSSCRSPCRAFKPLKVFVVKASLPEEKMYLFKTAVPSTTIKEMRQNMEFKLEENVPLSAKEALFFFDLIPKATGVTIENPKKSTQTPSEYPLRRKASSFRILKR